MLAPRTEQIVKTGIFGGIVAFLVFVVMNFWAYLDLHVVLYEWVTSWSLRTKLEAGAAASVFLPLGLWYSLRLARRNMGNVMTTYDR